METEQNMTQYVLSVTTCFSVDTHSSHQALRRIKRIPEEGAQKHCANQRFKTSHEIRNSPRSKRVAERRRKHEDTVMNRRARLSEGDRPQSRHSVLFVSLLIPFAHS